jgi:hypothetical protein
MSYGLDGRETGVLFMKGGGGRFSPPYRPDRLWGLHSLLSPLSPGVIRLGREADYPLPPSAEVNTRGSTPPFTHSSSRRSAYLIKHRADLLYFIQSTGMLLVKYRYRI